MRKKTKIIFIMICMCLSMGLFTGCKSEEEIEQIEQIEQAKQPVHTALILQSVTNVPVVNIEASGELLKEVCSTPGSSISIIIADGLPWEYANIKPEDIDDSFEPVMQEQILNQRLQELVQIVKSATAKNPESDLRRAIEMGARYLQSCENGRKEMVIFGSGINTVAPLSMQNVILSKMNVNDTIQKLENEAYIVNLEDINVTMFNLGDTAGEQKNLLNKDKKNLQTFWNAYFEKGNANNICFKNDLPLEANYEGLPKMSTVPVVEITSVPPENEITDVEGIVLDETQIVFEKGTAVLVNPEKATEVISVIAEYMIKNNTEALLVGGTAKWGELSDSITLSYERAKVIKELFVKAGVHENQLSVIGTGWLSNFYQNDNNVDGSLNENIAPSNRMCAWINTSTSLAETIWNDEDFNYFLLEE